MENTTTMVDNHDMNILRKITKVKISAAEETEIIFANCSLPEKNQVISTESPKANLPWNCQKVTRGKI